MIKQFYRDKLNRTVLLLGTILCCLALVGCSAEKIDWDSENEVDVAIETTETMETDDKTERDVTQCKKILVYVCGEVENPGVYELDENSRLFMAINAAGGMTENANKNYQNLARTVVDGEQIFIPDISENQVDIISSSDKNLININKADEKELMKLAGIGESRAKAIVAYRDANGLFKKIDDIKKVEGIKDSLFQKIKDLITV